jgi:hypothetical protein
MEFIFSQIQELGEDTFLEFSPYTKQNSTISRKIKTFDPYTRKKNKINEDDQILENSNFTKIKINNIELQDEKNSEIDSSRIIKPLLILSDSIFAIEYEDSFYGKYAFFFIFLVLFVSFTLKISFQS